MKRRHAGFVSLGVDEGKHLNFGQNGSFRVKRKEKGMRSVLWFEALCFWCNGEAYGRWQVIKVGVAWWVLVV